MKISKLLYMKYQEACFNCRKYIVISNQKCILEIKISHTVYISKLINGFAKEKYGDTDRRTCNPRHFNT